VSDGSHVPRLDASGLPTDTARPTTTVDTNVRLAARATDMAIESSSLRGRHDRDSPTIEPYTFLQLNARTDSVLEGN
jgi:hypothetical protein